MRRIVTTSMVLALVAASIALAAPAQATVNNVAVQCGNSPSGGSVTVSPSTAITGAVNGDTVVIGALSAIASANVSLSGVTGPTTISSTPQTYVITSSSPSYIVVTVASDPSGLPYSCVGKSVTISINGGTPSSGGSSATSSAPDPIVQQFGMPASGTCADTASESLNWGGASSGGWGESWAEWMHGGLGGAVCTRTLVYSTSSGAWAAS